MHEDFGKNEGPTTKDAVLDIKENTLDVNMPIIPQLQEIMPAESINFAALMVLRDKKMIEKYIEESITTGDKKEINYFGLTNLKNALQGISEYGSALRASYRIFAEVFREKFNI